MPGKTPAILVLTRPSAKGSKPASPAAKARGSTLVPIPEGVSSKKVLAGALAKVRADKVLVLPQGSSLSPVESKKILAQAGKADLILAQRRPASWLSAETLLSGLRVLILGLDGGSDSEPYLARKKDLLEALASSAAGLPFFRTRLAKRVQARGGVVLRAALEAGESKGLPASRLIQAGLGLLLALLGRKLELIQPFFSLVFYGLGLPLLAWSLAKFVSPGWLPFSEGPRRGWLGIFSAAGLSILVYVLVRVTWIQRHDWSETLTVIGLGALALGLLQGKLWPLSLSARKDPAPAVAGPGLAFLTGALALGSGLRAIQAAGFGQWNQAGIFLALVLLFLHPAWRRPPEARLGMWGEAFLLACITGAGLFLRLYKVGDVPEGMILDESLMMVSCNTLLGGYRPTVSPQTWYGCVPEYLGALSMRLFGDSVRGFRLGSALIGSALIPALWAVARAFWGAWPALFAAALAAVEMWPVTTSRVQYLEHESAVMYTAALAFYAWGLRRRSHLFLVAAGLLIGTTFNSYFAGLGVVVLFPLLAAPLLLSQGPGLRREIPRIQASVGAGALMSLSPLFLWFFQPHDPGAPSNVSQFFNLFGYTTVLSQNPEHMGLHRRLTDLSSVLIRDWPRGLGILIQGGAPKVLHFLLDMAIVSKATLLGAAIGLALCLGRVRSWPWAYTALWAVIGMVPGIITMTSPDNRRMIMAMPAILLLGGLGLSEITARLLAFLGLGLRPLAAALALFSLTAWVAKDTYHRYFVVLNENAEYKGLMQTQTLRYARAVYAEDKKSPVCLLSYVPFCEENPLFPLPAMWVDKAFSGATFRVPILVSNRHQDDRAGPGVLEELAATARRGGPDREVLVALDPFHHYLAPLLLDKLGGRLVGELTKATTVPGFTGTGTGFIPYDKGPWCKLIRLPQARALQALVDPSIKSLNLTFESLKTPPGIGVNVLAQESEFSPEGQARLHSYARQPESWGVASRRSFRSPDPYFWSTAHNFYGIEAPYRMKTEWTLNIPAGQDRELGLNASVYTRIFVDGRMVLEFWPDKETVNQAQSGFFPKGALLKPGSHRIRVEQAVLVQRDCIMHEFRLLVRSQDGDAEALPLEWLKDPNGL